MSPPIVTSIYACFAGLLAVGLSFYVIRLRQTGRVSLGTGGNAALERAVRAHANLVEHAPLALVLIALLELNGGNPYVLHAAAASLLIGRSLHAWALIRGTFPARLAGMVLTFTCYFIVIPANLVAVARLAG
jgi:uncharacterized protein